MIPALDGPGDSGCRVVSGANARERQLTPGADARGREILET